MIHDSQGFLTSFRHVVKILIFILFYKNYLIILKILTETLLRILFFVIGLAAFGMISQDHMRLPV
jgi:hypothetical protein